MFSNFDKSNNDMAQPKKDKNKNSLFLHCLTFIKKKRKIDKPY